MLQDKHKQQILDLVPGRLHPLIKGSYRTVFPQKDSDNSDIFAHVPDKLPEKALQDVSIHPAREDMLECFPQEGNVAELGVYKGEFAEKILSSTNPEELFLIDVWDLDNTIASGEDLQIVKAKFSKEVESGEVTIVKERSEVALADFEDEFFEWVYIDTSHTYEQTLKELEMAGKKVKNDGIIAGHDYCTGDASTESTYGVIPAVHEFCVTNGWRISHLSLETHGHHSFGLEKLDT